jgi:hypothetical protein
MAASEVRIWAQDSMTRIFPQQTAPRHGGRHVLLQAARNEIEDFQIGVCGPPRQLNEVRATASPLTAEGGAVIDAGQLDMLYADYVPVHWHSPDCAPDDLEGSAPGFYPDPLLPELWRGVGRVQFPGTISVWVRVRVPETAVPGTYRGEVEVCWNGGRDSVAVELQVWPFVLPRRSHLRMTNWFLPGPILQFHRLQPMTEQFWQVIDLYARNLADHRQNVILTPFTSLSGSGELRDGRIQAQLVDICQTAAGEYAFDFAAFDRWVECFFQHGFELIEGGHLAGGSERPALPMVRRPGQERAERLPFTSTREPEYRAYLEQFLKALRRHLAKRGWLERFVLHLSDEPHGDQFEAYTGLSGFVKGIAPEIPLIDAMGAPEYAPYADHPVPIEHRYEEFVQASGKPREQVWFYYCCAPTGPWPNRFLDYPLIRVRIFTWAAFRYGIPGFLHWGLNHWGWHPPFYREEVYNPYDNTTGGSLQAGDSYVLYPPRMPSQSHEPVNSIRWEIVRKAMEDYEYLYLLRERVAAGKGNSLDVERGAALLRELEEEVVPTMAEHTRDARYLANFRRRVGEAIARL